VWPAPSPFSRFFPSRHTFPLRLLFFSSPPTLNFRSRLPRNGKGRQRRQQRVPPAPAVAPHQPLEGLLLRCPLGRGRLGPLPAGGGGGGCRRAPLLCPLVVLVLAHRDRRHLPRLLDILLSLLAHQVVELPGQSLGAPCDARSARLRLGRPHLLSRRSLRDAFEPERRVLSGGPGRLCVSVLAGELLALRLRW